MTYAKIKLVWGLLLGTIAGVAACGTSDMPTGFAIVRTDGGALNAVAGDSLSLTVMETFSDGKQQALPPGSAVAWTAPLTVTAVDSGNTGQSPMPELSTAPTALFIDNALRPERTADLGSVLFIVDIGTSQGGSLSLTAALSGAVAGTATATIPVAPTPAGDESRGSTLYAMACAGCHGATGSGTAANPDGTFSYAGGTYDYPAPGINGADGNLASDPGWSPALLAMAARADIDNGGVVLRKPMPDWLSRPVSGGHILGIQDFADIYAFLATQTQ